MPQSTSWTAWNRPGGTSSTGGTGTAADFQFSDWFTPGDTWGQTKGKGNRLGGAASGALSGAAAGTAIAPGIGTAIGAVGGGILGAISGGPKELSPGEQWVNNWDVLGNQALQTFGPEAIGRSWQGIQDWDQALSDFQAMGPPDTSGAEAAANQVGANINALSNFSPRRIDRQIGDWRKLMQTGMGSIVNPSMLAANQQSQEAMKAIGANPMLSAQQRQLMQTQQQRSLAQTNAMQQGQAIQAGMSAIDDLAKTGDTLVLKAKEAAASLGMSFAQLKLQLAAFPYEYQMKLISLLAQRPQMYMSFMQQFAPGQNQYGAAQQGGRTGFDWMGAIQKGAEIYKGIKGGGGTNNLSNFQGGSPGSPGASNFGLGNIDWMNQGRTRDF